MNKFTIMAKKPTKSATKPAASKSSKPTSVWAALRWLKQRICDYWHQNWWHKIFVSLAILLLLIVAGAYGVSRWYMWSNRNVPYEMGVTFIPDYARSLKVDPKETMDALIDDMGVRRFRLVSYWNQIEKKQGTYDWRELDWQFDKVNEINGKVSLAIGLRQPRWPECHMPDWAAKQDKSVWAPKLKDFMGAVIKRYGNNPALESYQLENEYFLAVFGVCPDHSRERLVDEFDYVKRLAPNTPVIISRSNNLPSSPLRAPVADVYGVSVYQRVWDRTITKRYFEYPFPGWYYGALAGMSKILQGRDTMLHEMQAEPWPPNGQSVVDTPLYEQDKSLNAKRLQQRFDLGRSTGMRQVDFWGAEWWYWRKVKAGDDSVWNVAKDEFQKQLNEQEKPRADLIDN